MTSKKAENSMMKFKKEKFNQIIQVLKKIRESYEKNEVFVYDFYSLSNNKKPQKIISIKQNTWQKNKSFMINPPFEPKEALVDGEIYIETILYLFALWAYEYLTDTPYEMDLSKVKYPGLFQFFSKLLIDDFRERSNDFDELELYLNIAIEDIEKKHFKRLENYHFVIEGNTTVGMLRYENQDTFDFDIYDKNAIVVVADGMGGGSCGDVASRIAVNTMMQNRYKLWEKEESEINDFLKDIVMNINEKIIHYKKQQKLTSMGTTLSVLVIKGESIFFAHVGDSRIYLKYKDTNEYQQITLDHSLAEVEYREGKITKEKKEEMSKSVLAFVLGSEKLKRENINTADDYRDNILWEDIDEAILCSDGCWDIVEKYYFQNSIDFIFNISAQHIMHDNMTVVKLAKVKTTPIQKRDILPKSVTYSTKNKKNILYSSFIYILIMLILLLILTIPIFFTHTQGERNHNYKVIKQRKIDAMPKMW